MLSDRRVARHAALGAAVLVLAAGAVTPVAAVAAERGGPVTISGTVSLAPTLTDAPAAGDRLVLKIHHPRNGQEVDPTYSIQAAPALPMPFRIGPNLDMNGLPRWPTYVVEAFTDRDGDIETLSPGEFYARTPDAVPLGTEGVVLELAPVKQD